MHDPGMSMRWSFALLLFALACSQPPAAEVPTGGGATTPPVATAAPASKPVADGVLAEVVGASGHKIKVEQRAGRRLLHIDDTLHASVAWTATGPDPAAVDPLVSLLRSVRPAAKTALVIGLGSGDTAGDLARAGLEVTAVEIDPQVIEVARTWFGYQGKAVASEGRAFLEKNPGPWDLVIMDAFDGLRAPPRLVDASGVTLLRERTAKQGVTALRLHGKPTDKTVARIRRALDTSRHGFQHLYGSGVGAEEQNLYLIVSDAPLNRVAIEGAAMWPLPDDPDALQNITAGAAGDAPTPSRTVTLVGYVHKLAGGELALDLPHAEMGAIRYLLTGDAARALDVLPAGARFPTTGDIETDGDTSKTLRALLGGGGAKRNDVRFSPVVAAVRGEAKLVAVVHPDAASRVPKVQAEGAIATDDRIPYGGALYDLAVTQVLWTLDRAAWSAVAPELERRAAKAGKAAAGADLATAATELSAWADVLGRKLGEHSDLMPAVHAARALAAAMPGELERARAKGTPFATAAACDRLHYVYRTSAPAPVAAGLYRCAVRNYERAAAGPDPTDANTYDAAARLVDLLGADPDDKDTERQRNELRKKFKISIPLQLPPGLSP